MTGARPVPRRRDDGRHRHQPAHQPVQRQRHAERVELGAEPGDRADPRAHQGAADRFLVAPAGPEMSVSCEALERMGRRPASGFRHKGVAREEDRHRALADALCPERREIHACAGKAARRRCRLLAGDRALGDRHDTADGSAQGGRSRCRDRRAHGLDAYRESKAAETVGRLSREFARLGIRHVFHSYVFHSYDGAGHAFRDHTAAPPALIRASGTRARRHR